MKRASDTSPDRGPIKATKDDWHSAALHMLMAQGIDSVMILPLAKMLNVSRSSFYWYFTNRQDLLDHLLGHWTRTNNQAILDHANRPSSSIVAAVLNVFECWVDERLFSPRLDFAIRNWARQSKPVRKLIDKADSERLAAIRQMYERHGYSSEDALIRARVLYYMQLGYYALDVKEPMEARLSHVESYLRAFTGKDPTDSELQRFVAFVNGSQAARQPNRRPAKAA